MRITKKENMEKIKQIADYCHGTYYSLSFIAVIKIKCTLCLIVNLQVFSTKHKCLAQNAQQTEERRR